MKAILFPGQGAQFKGMGKALFDAWPQQTRLASEILGYPLQTLCVEDPENRLRLTQYTQPALFVVNALHYFQMREQAGKDWHADFLVGHSLGEYNALLAAGAFDFATGVQLVKRRGELMAAATAGGMAVVFGISAQEVTRTLRSSGLDGIDLANFNSPVQFVIAGPVAAIAAAEQLFSRQGVRCVVLNVSAAFHSRYMQDAQREFGRFLQGFQFAPLAIPVIANVTARPYQDGQVAELLADQITSSVLWSDSIRYLERQGEITYEEVGATILGKMVSQIQSANQALVQDK